MFVGMFEPSLFIPFFQKYSPNLLLPLFLFICQLYARLPEWTFLSAFHCVLSKLLSCRSLYATRLATILPHKQNSKRKGFSLPLAFGSVINNSLLETLQLRSMHFLFSFLPPWKMCHFSLSLLESHGVYSVSSCRLLAFLTWFMFRIHFFFNHGGETSMNLEYFLGGFAH